MALVGTVVVVFSAYSKIHLGVLCTSMLLPLVGTKGDKVKSLVAASLYNLSYCYVLSTRRF